MVSTTSPPKVNIGQANPMLAFQSFVGRFFQLPSRPNNSRNANPRSTDAMSDQQDQQGEQGEQGEQDQMQDPRQNQYDAFSASSSDGPLENYTQQMQQAQAQARRVQALIPLQQRPYIQLAMQRQQTISARQQMQQSTIRPSIAQAHQYQEMDQNDNYSRRSKKSKCGCKHH